MALYLARGHAFLALGHHVDDQQPLTQADVSLVEDGPDRQAEIVAAGTAAYLVAMLEPVNVLALAAWANDALRPAGFFDELTGVFFGAGGVYELQQVH